MSKKIKGHDPGQNSMDYGPGVRAGVRISNTYAKYGIWQKMGLHSEKIVIVMEKMHPSWQGNFGA